MIRNQTLRMLLFVLYASNTVVFKENLTLVPKAAPKLIGP